MKKLVSILFAILYAAAACGAAAVAQQTAPVSPNAIVERVDVSGISDSRLTAELRADIQALTGKPYDEEVARQLAQGIQIELPEYVAAATPQPGTQPDRIRLVFLVAKIADSEALKTNINSRYIVDSVEFTGSQKPKISPELNADLQAMVGKNLDNDVAEALRKRILQENREREVVRKLRRGASPDHVKILYEVSKSNSIGFGINNPGYHSKEGFYGPTLTITGHSPGYGTLKFTMVNDADSFVERAVGGALAYSLSHGDLKLNLEYSSYRAQWKPNTLEADRVSPQSPGLYRLRDAGSVGIDFKLPFELKASAGAQVGGQQTQSPSGFSYRTDNAFTGKLSTDYNGRAGWEYSVQSGTGMLDSDLIYTRHRLFTYVNPIRPLHVEFTVGRTTGNAPMYERFSVGSRNTLRGWNKYEITPLGGDRLVNLSFDYGYKFLHPFYDVGSAWNAGGPAVFRQSVGISIFQACKPTKNQFANIFCSIPITVGFPIRHGNARPIFMVGF